MRNFPHLNKVLSGREIGHVKLFVTLFSDFIPIRIKCEKVKASIVLLVILKEV